jgi:hypothetical protein
MAEIWGRHLLVLFAASSLNLPIFWPALGAGAGIYLFYRGFRLLQRKRLILDTPTAKVRSAAMGLVELNGLACGPYTIIAPITGKPCYYYRTTAWRYEQRGKSREWVKVADETLHLPFYLDDNTGCALVNPQGAELDIHRDYQQEFHNSFLSMSQDMPANVANFLTRHGVPTDKKLKLEEYCIKPKNALFILGTLAVNPGLEVTATPIGSNPVITKFSFKINGTASATLSNDNAIHVTRTLTLASPSNGTLKPEVIRLSSDARPSSSSDMTQQQKIAAALSKAGITSPAAWAAAGITDTVLAAPHGDSNGAAAAVAPERFDLHPPVVLMKGEHNPAFFISWRSQKDVLKSLGWKSTAMIWGGPVLTLVSVYLLAAQFGWL